MFATIAGTYPPSPGPPEAALDAVLTDQLEAGLGMVGEGVVRALTDDAAIAAAVHGWTRAGDRVGALAGERGLPAPPVKPCLRGPLSDPGADPVTRVRAAILALHAAGAPLVQVDEPWLTDPAAATPEGRARAADAWAALLDGVTGHVSLAIPGGGASAIGAEALVAAPFGSYLVDLVTGPDDWRPVRRLPGDRGVILGVADLRRTTPDDPEVIVWAVRYAASMHGRGLARVGVAPAAGLEHLSRETAKARLTALAEAARIATLPPEELVRTLDPRSIDARSAALGRFEPPPRAPRPGPPDR
ncbi:MAG: hypothetical protein U0869_20085 [Chloroflexota bacterium]